MRRDSNFSGHAADRPKQIHGGGARLADGFADLVEVFLESATFSALEFFTPRAMPMAAATPMAGAPRTTMLRITSATCWCVVQVTYTSSVGSFV
jgi:hypothetical protein